MVRTARERQTKGSEISRWRPRRMCGMWLKISRLTGTKEIVFNEREEINGLS